MRKAFHEKRHRAPLAGGAIPVLALAVWALVGTASTASAHGWSSARPDGHAPIGVMGDHTHAKGEWMLSYRYRRMDMDGSRDGTHGLSTSEVLQDYAVAPESMEKEMHVLGAMYAVSDRLTLTAMLPYVEASMDHATRGGGRFTTRTSGLGDVRVGGLYVLHRWGDHQVHLNAGVSVPTGSIDERDATPMGNNQRLPYGMQLGSGTYDLLPGITYLGQAGDWSWGSQANATLRLGENDRDYRLGNRVEVTGWMARRFSPNWSGSLRLTGTRWGDIHGADPALNPAMSPMADPDLQGGRRLDAAVGVNFYDRSGAFQGHRLALEVGTPVYQDLDGPQMEMDWMAVAGWQYAW